MSTIDKLNEEIITAMKNKDVVRRTTLRMAMSAIKEVEKEKGELSEEEVIAILQKQVKARNESIADAEKAGRPELAEEANVEKEILAAFLPEEFSEEKLMEMVKAAIAESGAQSPREMGKVMAILVPQTRGRADGKVVSSMVSKLLQG